MYGQRGYVYCVHCGEVAHSHGFPDLSVPSCDAVLQQHQLRCAENLRPSSNSLALHVNWSVWPIRPIHVRQLDFVRHGVCWPGYDGVREAFVCRPCQDAYIVTAIADAMLRRGMNPADWIEDWYV